MRFFTILIFLLLAFIVWKIVKIFFTGRNLRNREPRQGIEFPPDQSYKNIEDADFEDISSDSDKPS